MANRLNNLAEGIFNVGLRHGIDTRDFTLFAYGAAGPMMLPAMLDLVPLRRVIVPPHPGLFSARGLLSSDQVFTEELGVAYRLSSESLNGLEGTFGQWNVTFWRGSPTEAPTKYASSVALMAVCKDKDLKPRSSKFHLRSGSILSAT